MLCKAHSRLHLPRTSGLVFGWQRPPNTSLNTGNQSGGAGFISNLESARTPTTRWASEPAQGWSAWSEAKTWGIAAHQMRKPGDYDRLQGCLQSCTHLAVSLAAVNSPTSCETSDTRALMLLLPTRLVVQSRLSSSRTLGNSQVLTRLILCWLPGHTFHKTRLLSGDLWNRLKII